MNLLILSFNKIYVKKAKYHVNLSKNDIPSRYKLISFLLDVASLASTDGERRF